MRLKLSKDKTKIGVAEAYEHKDELREIGAKWNARSKLWVLPATPIATKELLERFGDDVDLADMPDKLRSLVKAACAVDEAALAKDTVDGEGPESRTRAWGHQVKAYNFVMKLWGLK